MPSNGFVLHDELVVADLGQFPFAKPLVQVDLSTIHRRSQLKAQRKMLDESEVLVKVLGDIGVTIGITDNQTTTKEVVGYSCRRHGTRSRLISYWIFRGRC